MTNGYTIDKIKAGNYLDMLVDVAIFGRTVEPVYPDSAWMRRISSDDNDPNCYQPIPEYSTNIADAWKVVEEHQMSIEPVVGGGWAATSYKDFRITVIAETAPLAICHVALKFAETWGPR